MMNNQIDPVGNGVAIMVSPLGLIQQVCSDDVGTVSRGLASLYETTARLWTGINTKVDGRSD